MYAHIRRKLLCQHLTFSYWSDLCVRHASGYVVDSGVIKENWGEGVQEVDLPTRYCVVCTSGHLPINEREIRLRRKTLSSRKSSPWNCVLSCGDVRWIYRHPAHPFHPHPLQVTSVIDPSYQLPFYVVVSPIWFCYTHTHTHTVRNSNAGPSISGSVSREHATMQHPARGDSSALFSLLSIWRVHSSRSDVSFAERRILVLTFLLLLLLLLTHRSQSERERGAHNKIKRVH